MSGAIEYCFDGTSIFRMGLSNDARELGCNCLVKSVDPKGLRRPVNLIGYGIPAETAGVARSLGLIEVGLTAPQCLLGAPALAVLLL